MKICDFTKPELDRFRKDCNFTDIERQCFDLKARDKTIALEASWELDPVLMENKLWKRIEEEPEQKAYAVKSDEKKKA